MWPNFDHTTYDHAGFAAHVAALHWTTWKPQGVTLHNTGAPSLVQWAESGAAHEQRMANLLHYYQDQLGWHAGPHLFVSRAHVSGFSDPLQPGVHASCFNRTHLGVEMAGDFATEAFDSGDGALVRDTAVFALATLLRKLGLGISSVNFHRDCARDHHACPGKHVDKSAFLGRLAEALKAGQTG